MNNPPILNSLLSEEIRIKDEISVLKETLNALQVVIKMYSGKSHSTNSVVENIRANYINQEPEKTDGLSYEGREPETHIEKVYAILSVLKSARAKEVGDELLLNYPNDFTAQRAFDVATLQLSKLKKEGKISGEKILGKNSYLYSIINEEAHDDI